MLTKFLNHRLTSLITFGKRPVTLGSSFDLGKQMQLFNDNKQFREALKLFDKYKKNNIETCSSLVITQALKASAHLRNLQYGKTIHHSISSRIDNDSYILASLVHMYMQCGDVACAQSLFDTTTRKTLAIYGAMMKGYIENKQANKAIDVFKEIKNPNEIIIIVLFNACAQLGTVEALDLTKKVSKEISKSFHSNPRLLTSLLDALMKCGDVEYAQSLFDKTTNKVLSMYGAMMKGYIENKQPNKAIDLFKKIQNSDEITTNLLFNACAQLGTVEALHLTKQVSEEMSKSFHSNPYILTSLLDALMKCGDLEHAQSLFDKTTNKSLPLYGAMMKGYIQNEQANKAIDVFKEIKNPNEIIIIVLFNACAQLGTVEALDLTKKVSKEISKTFHSNPRLLTSLLDALMQCGDVEYAQSLFDKTTNKVLSMYGAMMKGYIENKQANKAIDLFKKIQNPNEITTNLLFNACAQLETVEALDLTKQVSEEMPKSFHSNPYILTSLLDALMKCGDVEYAQSLFDKTTNKSLPLYGAMMKGYIENKQANKAIDVFKEIKNPDEVIIIVLFNACAQLGTVEALDLTKKVSKEISKSFHSNPRLLTSLLDALMKCGDVEYAQSLFDKTTNKVLSMYGAMMKGYIENKQPNKAIDLFKKIQNSDEITTNLLFNACAQLETVEALHLTKQVSEEMPKSFHSNPYILTSLLDALMKCGDLEHAQSLFDKTTNKSLPLYGAMMKGYIENKQANKAIDVFKETKNPDAILTNLVFNACAQLGTVEALDLVKDVAEEMPKSFHSNSYILTSLLDALMKCGDVEYAQSLFDKTTNKSLPLYGVMMNGYNKNNNPVKSLNLFDKMKNDGFEGNSVVYFCVIKSLSKLGDYSLCQSIVKKIPDCVRDNNQIKNALIDMWGKTGCVNEAREIFEKILEPNQIVYTTMINCYGLNGMGNQATELYRQMPEELIDEVTHICVLNACSHSGLINEARSIFQNIQIKTEEIYCTMIDCLSRGSLFEEAQELIDEYERLNSPVSPMYMALLSGARNVNNSYLSQNVYDRMKTLFPQMTNPLISAAILLANVYASSGDTDKASNIRNEIRQSGARKKIGLSWTVINGQVFEFRAHDQSHARSTEIYAELEKISNELIQHGHQYDSSWITRPINEDETVASVLCGHSERLAIAWNFVSNPSIRRVQVTKNLRVCGDCHRVTKLIAVIRQCEIIVRDANRIHHFYMNGQCSCNDYF